MKKYISPNHLEGDFKEPFSIDDKIEIFADRVRGWQLTIAERCVNIPHADFAALSIVFSYFEMVGNCIEGSTGSKASFRVGFKRVFPGIPAPDVTLNKLYEIVRNALYHFGTVRSPHLYITRDIAEPITYKDYTFSINPTEFIATIRAHFEGYITDLKKAGNRDVRERFVRAFDGQTVTIPSEHPPTWGVLTSTQPQSVQPPNDKEGFPSSSGGTVTP